MSRMDVRMSPSSGSLPPEEIRWIASLEKFGIEPGLERMRAMLTELGEPQRAFRAVHVVGTNGKSTATRTVEALLLAEGVKAGAYLSPHVSGWSERIRIAGREADFEVAVARVRAVAQRARATQFEALTLAAFVAFAGAGVEVAAVEAGLGGRLDATNVVDAPVVVLTNVGLDHTERLGGTRELIAREKLAVLAPGATAVLGEPEWADLARELCAGEVVVVPYEELARTAVSRLLGRPVTARVEVALPGRLERRGPSELWDGAHNPHGVAWLRSRLPEGRYVLVVGILADKAVEEVLAGLAGLADTLVATAPPSPRALPAHELARLARAHFAHVEVEEEPAEAVRRAHAVAGGATVLVTGSLSLLAGLAADRSVSYDAEVR